jgi:hypothetical protein
MGCSAATVSTGREVIPEMRKVDALADLIKTSVAGQKDGYCGLLMAASRSGK